MNKSGHFQKCLILSLYILFTCTILQAQVQSLKGDGEVFYLETFDWGNPDDERGWTQPDGFYMEDPTDNGFNWHWWPNDSLISENVAEPPFQSTSRADGHLCLFADLYNDFVIPPEKVSINNSIVFPPIDCSEHSSVILQFETTFINMGLQGHSYGGYVSLVEVSNDYGLHWASFNADFNAGHKIRPDHVAPGEPALFRINITPIAAGMPNVIIRINWQNYFGTYYWLIDDFEFVEALDNDIKLQYIDIQWDDLKIKTAESISYMMPISQLGNGHSFHLFTSGVINMGEFVQTDVDLDFTITRDNSLEFHTKGTIPTLDLFSSDTLVLDGAYEPTEFGHYAMQYKWTQAEEDDKSEDNEKNIFFHVTDSVYSRAGEQPDYLYSYNSLNYVRDGWDFHANLNQFMGSIFPIYGDCEIDGVSVYIMGGLADGLIDFRYTVWRENDYLIDERMDPFLLLATENVALDSAMFNKWVYMPFDKDGESEFLMADSLYYIGVEYNNWHEDEVVRRDFGMSIGATDKAPTNDYKAIIARPSRYTGNINWGYQNKNLMIRLIINDHTNRIDSADDIENPFSLLQNYPNPFLEETEIAYVLDIGAYVTIVFTDITGRKIMEINEGFKSIGKHSFSFKGTNLKPGVYFYTLKAGAHQETKSMIISD